jgi:hypothetical protein
MLAQLHRTLWPYRPIGLAGAGVVALLALLLTLGTRGWPGAPDVCLARQPDTCYCENYTRPGPIKQPANTWSNLGFVAAGLLVLGQTRRLRRPARVNPMTAPGFYATLYGALVVFLGPASMFFHASLRAWGGWIDLVSMMLYSSFLLTYDLVRIRGASRRVFVAIYLPLVLAQGLADALVPKSGQLLFGAGIAGVLVLEGLILSGHVPGLARQGWPWFVIALGLFAAAYGGIWLWSNTAGPLCDPDSVLQGHALWHLLCAASTLCLYQYLRTEQRTGPAAGPAGGPRIDS